VVSATFYSGVAERVPDRSEGQIRSEVIPLNPPDTGDEALDNAALGSSTDALHLAMIVTALSCFAGAAVNAVGIRNEHALEESESTTAAAPGVAAG
jgi:hypothetical protein